MPPEYVLRPIEPRDDSGVAALIRTVMPEFGAAGPGTALHDPEVSAMSAAYSQPGWRYFVAVEGGPDGPVLAGAGIAPLPESDGETAELRKMYAHARARGRGIGQALLTCCLDAAGQWGYRRVYLETLPQMEAAQVLYRRCGFEVLANRRGNTGHHACGLYYQRELEPRP
jgi:putative acetyltransferase